MFSKMFGAAGRGINAGRSVLGGAGGSMPAPETPQAPSAPMMPTRQAPQAPMARPQTMMPGGTGGPRPMPTWSPTMHDNAPNQGAPGAGLPPSSVQADPLASQMGASRSRFGMLGNMFNRSRGGDAQQSPLFGEMMKRAMGPFAGKFGGMRKPMGDPSRMMPPSQDPFQLMGPRDPMDPMSRMHEF